MFHAGIQVLSTVLVDLGDDAPIFAPPLRERSLLFRR
jgi:hypothetical protein